MNCRIKLHIGIRFILIMAGAILIIYMLASSNLNRLRMGMEYGYFEGQVDALKGDVKIDTLRMKWTANPWADGYQEPMYEYRNEYRGKVTIFP